MMQIGIIQFPGSNCERETSLAVERAGMKAVPCLWNENPERVAQLHGYVIVGGFSFEDRARAGIIAALHPLMQVIKQQAEQGKPVLGICNGAQILVETGMVPGFSEYPLAIALCENKRVKDGQILGTGFYNQWVHVKANPKASSNAFCGRLSATKPIQIPAAHAQGRFSIPQPMQKELHQRGMIALQYCDAEAELNADFPTNPNGSDCNIAALCNPAGNVMAIMPHPERSPNGDAIFLAMRDTLEAGIKPIESIANPCVINPEMGAYRPAPSAQQMIVELMITDNAAFSVEMALQQRGLSVKIQRHTHWEIGCDSPGVLHQIQASGVLFNDQKERLITPGSTPAQSSLLIRAREDWLGQERGQQLQHHFGIQGVRGILHGVLWRLDSEIPLQALMEPILKTNLLFNPVSHECFIYE